MPLVLVENEVRVDGHEWRDLTGEIYHFPNSYRSRVHEGDAFVYYRGVHTGAGKRRPAVYFGTGTIGAVWKDPETDGRQTAWFARIEGYQPFATPVPAKYADDTTREDVGNSGNMYFRNGVRRISDGLFAEILAAGGPVAPVNKDAAVDPGPDVAMPPIEAVVPVQAEEELMGRRPASRTVADGLAPRRLSGRAKAIGDRAEEIVFQELRRSGHVVTWRARNGETPGWDMDYQLDGRTIRVEVKGSVTDRLVPLEFTRNEMRAAQEHGADYHLYLVARVFDERPSWQVKVDPATTLEAEPGSWLLWLPA